MDDWASKSRPDLFHFVPYTWHVTLIMKEFEFIVMANEHNWVDCFGQTPENGRSNKAFSFRLNMSSRICLYLASSVTWPTSVKGRTNDFNGQVICQVTISLKMLRIWQPWNKPFQITKFIGPTWGPPGSCRPQMGFMLAPWALWLGMIWLSILSCYKWLTFALLLIPAHIAFCGEMFDMTFDLPFLDYLPPMVDIRFFIRVWTQTFYQMFCILPFLCNFFLQLMRQILNTIQDILQFQSAYNFEFWCNFMMISASVFCW